MKLRPGNQQLQLLRKIVMLKRKMQKNLQLHLKKIPPQQPKLLLPKPLKRNQKKKKITLKPMPIGSPVKTNPISQSAKSENPINRNGKLQRLC